MKQTIEPRNVSRQLAAESEKGVKYGWDTYCYVGCEEETEEACETCERRLQVTSCPICEEPLKLHEIQAGAKMCGECYETYDSDDLDRAILRGKSPSPAPKEEPEEDHII